MTSIPTDLYDLLLYILNIKQPKEIEILTLPFDNLALPDGADAQLAPYLFAEGFLGIPKKVLVKAFLSARKEFISFKRRGVNFDCLNKEDATKLDGMSKVMLLFDSEYQTAINIRKRLIRQQHVSLDTELHFLNTIFTSPLHRHTKSPLLWSHRHFCIQILPPSSLPSITEELTILFSAGERHPKNYHAWTYARFIFMYLFEKEEGMRYVIRVVFERLRSWCEMHPGDISGWTFFLWFLGKERPWQGQLEESGVRNWGVVTQVTEGMKIRRGHEAQWAFVRGAVIGMEGVLTPTEARIVVVKVVSGFKEEVAGRERLTAEEERDWMFLERYFSGGKGREGINWKGMIQAYVKDTQVTE